MLKRRHFLAAAASSFLLSNLSRAQEAYLNGTPIAGIKLTHLTTVSDAPIVFYSSKVDPQSLINIFKAVGRLPHGKVGLKLTFSNWRGRDVKLDPKLIEPLIKELNATMVDTNYMDSARSDTRTHLATAKRLGFTEVGPIDIMDTDGEIALPVKDGFHLKTFITGKNLQNYDTLVSVVRFKGHNLARYGGTMKNLSICLGTARGACQVHSAGKVTEYFSSSSGKETSESMADVVKAALDFKEDRWIFINVLDSIEPKDGCSEAKNLGDLGILASTDPIAVDRAACDIVYGFAPNEEVRRRWETEHFTDSMDAANKLGIGKTQYRLQLI